MLVRNSSKESSESWEVRGVTRMNGLSVVDLDNVVMESDSDKHVRFSPREGYSQFNNEERLGRTQSQLGVWERYYGATVPAILEAGLRPDKIRRNNNYRKSSGTLSSDLTMDYIKTGLLRRKEKKRKNLQCFCKMFCFLLLLTSFLLVIIAVSIFLTKGRNYFGAL